MVSRNSINAIYTNERLKDELQEHEKTRQQLEHLATHDSLTSLPNRNLLNEQLDGYIKRARRNDEIFGIMFIDLDGFKDVNDTFGHAAGDEVLQQVAQRIKETVREVDSIARIGGDEFVVICDGLEDDGERIEKLANRILVILQRPFRHGEIGESNISASIGIAIYPANGKTIEELLNKADSAMYAVKSSGKGRVSVA